MKDNSLSLPSLLPLHVRENYSRTHELAAHYPQQGDERLLEVRVSLRINGTWDFSVAITRRENTFVPKPARSDGFLLLFYKPRLHGGR